MMKPRGPLMIEHRLIEKMLGLAKKEMDIINKTNKADPLFIDTLVDFIRIYADRTHHGKEEDILFRELENKKINDKDNIVMQELINEHKDARKVVGELVEARNKYVNKDTSKLRVIIDKISFLVEFYPKHIEKEDKVFFPNTEIYFSDNELDKMLNDFWEFDRKMIHEKYQKLYNNLFERYK